jgi:hypothetical protein
MVAVVAVDVILMPPVPAISTEAYAWCGAEAAVNP